MKLSNFDNKKVRIIDFLDNTYEGLAMHSSKEYNFHEYGVNEESLEFGCFRFWKSTIKKVTEIEEYEDKYGRLEEEIFQEKMTLIDEQLEYQDDNSIRLLKYIIDHMQEVDFKEELLKYLKGLKKYNENKELEQLINQILKEEI